MDALAAAGLLSAMPNPKITRDVRPLSPDMIDIMQGVEVNEDVAERADSMWSPMCAHMSESDNEQGFPPPPPQGGVFSTPWLSGHSYDSMEGPWSPTCTHVSTLGDERACAPMAMDLSLDPSEAESVPVFPLDDVKLHAWVDGLEVRGQAGYGVYFSHDEYTNISRPVVGPQANNRAEVLAVRAAVSAVREDQELCMYSDSYWCVDIFDNLELYKRRG